MNDFKDALSKAKERSRHGTGRLDTDIISDYALNLLESAHVEKTDDSFKYDYTYSNNRYVFPVLKCKILGMVVDGNS